MASLDDYDDDKTRLEDTTDSGHVPEGMEVNHPDDDEGGEGFDGSKEEEKEEDDDEPGMVDRAKINANHDPATANNEEDDEDPDNAVINPEEEGDEDDEEEDEDEDEEEEDEDDDEDEERSSRPRKKVRLLTPASTISYFTDLTCVFWATSHRNVVCAQTSTSTSK